MTLHILDVVDDVRIARVVGVEVAEAQLANTVRFAPGAGGGVIPASGGPFLALDAYNRPVRASGTGADAALRTDLAAGGGSALLGFTAKSATGSRPVEEKLQEVVSVADYAYGSTDAIAATIRAVAALDPSTPARLIFPRGAWTIGANVDWSSFRNITFEFCPGALIDNGSNTVILPERVVSGLGAAFTGSGSVTQKNRDLTPLAVAPSGYSPSGNEAAGLRALTKIVGGHNNIAWGPDALAAAEHTRYNIAIGARALSNEIGDPTGARSMVSPTEIGSYSSDGDGSIAVGDSALQMSRGGVENAALGLYALRQHPASRWNVAIGAHSQESASGNFNIGVGAYTLTVNAGNNNIALGWAALEGATSGSNIAIGHAAMNGSKTGTSNVIVAPLGLMSATNSIENSGLGQEVLKNLKSGDGNAAIGAFAIGSANSGTNNSALGRNALVNMLSGIGNTALGAAALSELTTYNNCTGVGAGAQVTNNDQIQFGNPNAVPYAWVSVQQRSDARDKADIRDTVLGLDFINALRPVDYRLDFRVDYDDGKPTGKKKRKRFHHGLIAQEVRDVIARTGIDFGGYQDHSVTGGDDVLSIGYAELIAPTIKALQESHAQVVELRGLVSDLATRLAALEAKA